MGRAEVASRLEAVSGTLVCSEERPRKVDSSTCSAWACSQQCGGSAAAFEEAGGPAAAWYGKVLRGRERFAALNPPPYFTGDGNLRRRSTGKRNRPQPTIVVLTRSRREALMAVRSLSFLIAVTLLSSSAQAQTSQSSAGTLQLQSGSLPRGNAQSQLCVDDPTYCSTGSATSAGSSSSGASSSSSGTASASGGGAAPAPVPDSICGNGFPMGLAGCY